MDARGGRRIPGRNDPCPCGSGRRYKQCHGGVGHVGRNADSTTEGGLAASHRETIGAQADASLSATAHAHEGVAAHQRGDVGSAERSYRIALDLDPEQPLALHYLGVTLHQRQQHAEALPLLERSVARVPQEPEFHNNLGLVLAALDRNEEAVGAFRSALDRKPGHAIAWNNLGLALQAMNRLDDAVDAYRHAIEASPAFAHAHWNLSLALLARGEYDEGWREYEWRLRLPELGGRQPSSPIPRWQGEDLRGRTLLVTAEQGLGDALQFVRFADTLAQRGVRVIVQAPVGIRPLLATAPGVAATIDVGDPLPDADAELPMLSLPLRLGITAGAVATGGRYLHADRALKTAAERQVLRDDRTTRNIGIAWAGSPNHRNDRRRSIPIAALAPLFSLPNVWWYSLQKGEAAAQIQRLVEARNVVPLNQRNEFADTAALVDSLDAIVTVDTSIAHLAGALAKPVDVLLPFAPDWRWGVSGSRTPWYETARLYRQRAVGEWEGAVGALRAALEAGSKTDA